MREFRVNSWVVSPSAVGAVIVNTDHPDYYCTYSIRSRRYSFGHTKFKVPVTIQRYLEANCRALGQTKEMSLRTFGVEIECYHPTNSDIRNDVATALRRAGIECRVPGYTHEVMRCWKIVTDSSIRGGTGLEVVSPVLKGEEGLQELKKVLEVLNAQGCRVNKSTGLHVHHGANDLSTDHLHKVFSMYRDNENIFDSLVSPSRRGNVNQYCGSLRYLSDTQFPSTRYSKVNHQSYIKYGTIEFRQHQGSLSFEKISHWVRLTQRVIERAEFYSGRAFADLSELISFMGLEEMYSWYQERMDDLSGVA